MYATNRRQRPSAAECRDFLINYALNLDATRVTLTSASTAATLREAIQAATAMGEFTATELRDAQTRLDELVRREAASSSGTINDGDTAGDWTACLDPSSGELYFWNSSTNETSWDQPREFTQGYVAPVDHAAGDTVNGWTPWMDPGSQDIYYVHDDGRVQWERPAEYARRFGS